MPALELIPSRFEFKYLLSEARALAVRDYVLAHVMPDEHSPADPSEGYLVCSLYLDSPRFDFFHQADQGLERRFKLRLRFYDNESDSPVFAEIKRRVNQVIVKQRAIVPRQAACNWGNGFDAAADCDASQWIADDGDAATAFSDFGQLQQQFAAAGRLFVTYRREAYVASQGDYARVTFDRQILGTVFQPGDPLVIPTTGSECLRDKVVLELKFNDRFPGWMMDVVRAFQLERCSVPKYVLCARACGLR